MVFTELKVHNILVNHAPPTNSAVVFVLDLSHARYCYIAVHPLPPPLDIVALGILNPWGILTSVGMGIGVMCGITLFIYSYQSEMSYLGFSGSPITDTSIYYVRT